MFVLALSLCALVTTAAAVPALAGSVLATRQTTIEPLTTPEITAFTPYASFASAAYCQSSTIATWACGTNCEANPGFEVTAVGGDGTGTPFWYVGFDPTLDTIVVAHEGTNTSAILSILEDADFVLTPLSQTLFPGVSTSILADNGFSDAHASSAPAVLAAVKTAIAAHPSAPVTITGHSLGAAIATLDAAYLPLHLPSTTIFRVVTFGLPRVGNLAWATYLSGLYPATFLPPSSSTLNPFSLAHINNKEDPVPILPPMLVGYHHPTGEVHIQDSGVWDTCPGMDNPSTLCSTGDVPTILEGNTADHDGPYNGVTMGC